MYIYNCSDQNELNVLHKISEEISVPLSGSVISEAKNVLQASLRYNSKCIGVSAIQCGIKKRYFWLKINDKHRLFINPIIINHSRFTKQIAIESCMSTNTIDKKDKYYVLLRYRWVELEWYDEDGNKYTERFNKEDTRHILHELDHLDGKLINEKGMYLFTS